MKAAQAVLARGGSALDAIEAGIRVVEADKTVVTVGRGGAPDLLGVVSCDAAVMDGATGWAGAVGNLRGFLHAVSVARQVMERLPHVLMVSEDPRGTLPIFPSDVKVRHDKMVTFTER